jgi:RNA polymerase sigma factor (sigma-70 family)
MTFAMTFDAFEHATVTNEPQSDKSNRLRQLFLAGATGDGVAHRTFLTEAAHMLRGFFRNRLRTCADDVEDLVQDTLMALHARRASYDPQYPITAWMFAIARYRLIDFLRHRSRRGGTHDHLDMHDFGEQDRAYGAYEAKRDVFALLNRLPAKQKTIIQLVKLEERGVKETAELTGYSESDIKVSIHRGLKTLARLAAAAAAA